MQHKTRFLVALLSLAGVGLSGVAAQAQDFPTHKGNNQRQGHNADPLGNSAGIANLRWWHPDSTEGAGGGVTRDNTSSLVTRVGTWGQPSISQEGSYPFIPTRTGSVAVDSLVSDFFNPASTLNNVTPIEPAYEYATTTPSRYRADPTDYDPTVPESGTAATFTWNLTPADPTPRNYSVWVWLPAGPTRNDSGFLRYPQRYFVYSVQYGSGQRFVDVVDTSIAGTGWVRLGSGGASTQKVFPYSGSGTMSVTLYNTVPRDSSGNLLNNVLQSETLVYADGAALANSYGTYRSSPIISMLSSGAVTAVTAALNKVEVAESGGSTVTVTKGIVSNYVAATGVLRWRFSPLEESDLSVTLDSPSGQVVVNPPAWTASTTVPDHMGQDCYTAALAADLASATDVVYTPSLAGEGDYDIYVWVPGSSVGNQFATQQAYEVVENGTPVTVYVDQDSGNGWVRLGARRWKHTTASPLSVHALNYSANAADATAGRLACTDAMRFVGAGNLAIDSTPVHVNGALIKMNATDPPVATDVVLVAAENGRIYCLDATGNGDGTTNVYWTYPSTKDSTNASWTDPNQVATLDGVGGIAEMPTHSGFNLSSALVERIGGQDRLYIGARNGRVYCIDMTGRGDMNLATRIPGTTRRLWSYPNDFPATYKSSNLGAFQGSLSFATTTAGPTIFVPAPQGRIYALDAEGDTGNLTTTVRWMYPELTSPTLGEIVCTPAIDADRIYFGTVAATDGARGEFYALNRNNGNVVWKFDGTTTVPAGDFRSSPAVVAGLTQGDTVFAANENNTIYALSAAGNGDGTTTIYWSTDELGTGVEGSLLYSPLEVYSTLGALTGTPIPVLMVPTTDGRFVGLLAEQGSLNRYSRRRAWEYDTLSPLVASMANGRNWLLGGSTDGTLYAFNPDSGPPIPPGPEPGRRTIVENDPLGDDYREAIVKFVSVADYKILRSGIEGVATPLRYETVAGMTPVTGNPLAFEWGETMYALVYNFPHDDKTPNGTSVPPPLVNYAFSVEGGAVRNISVESRPLAGNPPTSAANGKSLNGYTVLAYALQTGGQSSLAPGKGRLTITITTGALNNNGARQNVALDPTRSELTFYIANPLALVMNGVTDTMREIGYTVNPADPENLINGSAKTGSTTKDTSLLLARTGLIAHGQTGSTVFAVVDRSLMTLLRGQGRGLDNVRFERNELHWSGGLGAVLKPLDGTLYQGYEDYPVNYPNTSLDYPDIDTTAIVVTKDPNGDTENPVFSGVSLKPPTLDSYDTPTPATRVLNLTPFKVDINIPRFQPPNAQPTVDSAGDTFDAGYRGRQTVFVSGTGTGSAQRSGGRRDAYRTFILGGSVDIDERLTVETPTLDLGSLASGTGYNPYDPMDAANNTALSPLGTAAFKGLFKPFVVTNPGNVNLRALHLAKATQYSTGIAPWPIYAPANHELTWLDPMRNIVTTLDDDPRVAVTGNGNTYHSVVLQKARVGDRVATILNVNARRRPNANLGLTETWLTGNDFSYYPKDYNPMLAVTVPIGLPVGTYVQTMRIINEDDPAYPNNQALSLDQYNNGLETYSDPTFVVRFNVRETRLTNTMTSGTAPMIDDLMAPGTQYPFLHANAQPTVMRTSGGSLVVAWASTRSSFTAPEPTDAQTLRPMWQIYMGSLVGANPAGITSTSNPLRDLNYFVPNAGTQWFQRSAQAPYPTCATTADANALFGVDTAAGNSVLFDPVNTVNFGSPSFPTDGFVAPDGAGTYMAFVGEAQIQTPTGRLTVSRLFLGSVNIDSSGVANLNAPVLDNRDDGSMRKGKPSVVQVGNRAAVYLSANAAGKPELFFTTYNPSDPTVENRWSTLTGIPVGSGFESAASPSVFARTYAGATLGDLTAGTQLLEMTFVGKLSGRPNSEVFMGRMLGDGLGAPQMQGGRPRFAYYPQRTQEPLVADGGRYRAQGVAWNMRSTVKLEQVLDGVVTDLEITDAGGNPTTRTYNSTTGLLSFDTKLGGKVYVDQNMGTVRFSTATPANRAILLLTYQPRFLRVSGAGQNAAHSSPTTLFDHRMIGEASYWVNASGGAVDGSSTEVIRSDRYVLTYGRAAAGAGQTARPYMRTMRLGVQLPTAVFTQPDGRVLGFSVTGAGGAYQIDPANGRVYFTDVSENREVTVTYPAANEAGDSLGSRSVTAVVTLVPEAGETPIAIEQAVNEASITSLLDPFDPGGAVNTRRPGLIWLFWQSTRGGSPDLYFETIAPRLTPLSSAK